MSPTWKAALGVIVIFILGWFGGALTTLIITRQKLLTVARGDTQTMASVLVRQTTYGLGLGDNQRVQLRALILENVKQRKELQKQIQPQVWTYNRQTMDAINAVLTPEQRQKFQDNLLLFKTRYGRNPLNTGPDDGGSPAQQTASSGTNAAGSTPPPQ